MKFLKRSLATAATAALAATSFAVVNIAVSSAHVVGSSKNITGTPVFGGFAWYCAKDGGQLESTGGGTATSYSMSTLSVTSPNSSCTSSSPAFVNSIDIEGQNLKWNGSNAWYVCSQQAYLAHGQWAAVFSGTSGCGSGWYEIHVTRAFVYNAASPHIEYEDGSSYGPAYLTHP